MIAFDGRVLDGAVHPFDLPVGPGMIDLGEAMLDAVFRQRIANICVMYRAVGPSAWRGGKRNWMPLSVRTVWIL